MVDEIKSKKVLAEFKKTQKEQQISNQCFRAAIEHSPITIFSQDKELCYTRIYNPISIFNADSLMGKTDFEIYSPEEAALLTQIKRRVLDSDEGAREEIYLTINGKIYYFELTIEPLRDKAGNIIGIASAVEDITERKKAERELKEARDIAKREGRRIETVLNTIPAGVVIIEKPDGRITYVNRRAVELYGKRPARNLPMYLHSLNLKLFKPNGELFLQEELPTSQALLEGENVRGVEVMIEQPDKTRITVLANASPLRNEGGEIVGAIGVFQNITRRKRAEEEIKRLSEDLKSRSNELENVNKELETFCYAVSHDLKSPLITIGGFSQRLLERYINKLDDKGKQYLRHIYESSQRLMLLIEDLLRLSKLSQGVIKVKMVDLSTLVRSIIGKLRETCPERQVEFIVEEGLIAKGDERLLRIVLENLFSNAWKFTNKSLKAKIEFGLTRKEGSPINFVRDNGCGFDMASVEKLFQPFQRLHTTEEFPGTGIGLSTVKRIIHRHGGRIWAESVPGKGTTFFFSLSS